MIRSGALAIFNVDRKGERRCCANFSAFAFAFT